MRHHGSRTRPVSRLLGAAIAVLLVACAVPAGAAPGRKGGRKAARVVAIHPLKPLGLDAETVANLEGVLRGEVERVPGIRLVPEVRSRAVAVELGCDGKEACLAVYAKKLGAREVVHGVVAGLGEAYSIALKRVDRTGRVLGRVDAEVGGEREVLIDGIRAAAYRLLRPDLYTGSLEIVGDVEGAELYVDGEPRGTLPLDAPLTGLEPGQHAVKIVKKGYDDFDKFVDVRFQRTSVVEVDLASNTVSGVIYQEEKPPEIPLVKVVEAEAPAPPPPRSNLLGTVGWVTGGLGAVGLALGAGLGLATEQSRQRLIRDIEASGGPTERHVEEYALLRAQATQANVAMAVGGGLLAAGATMLAFDLLSVDEAPSEASALRIVPAAGGGPGLALVGRF